ncbi:MAG TPA: hypothetical protein VIA45_02595 [Thermoanaerobaculia bacterium]|jgi:hypothetical protein
MRSRRLVALAGYLILLASLAAAIRPAELARRVRLVARDSAKDLAVRRLDGSSAAFDRRYFYFLESARRRLPAGARGIAVLAPAPTAAHRDLALYVFAPRPALVAPKEIPPGWVLAVEGDARPAGWREIAKVSGGALLERAR